MRIENRYPFLLRTVLSSILLLSSAFSGQADDYVGQIRAEKILTTSTAGNGQKHIYLQTPNPEVTAMTVEIPPGAETGWHLHTVPVYAYVLAGQLEVILAEGQTLAFKQGDAIVEVQGVAHNGRNRGSETVSLAVFYTGEAGRSNVIRVDNPTPAGAALQ